MSHYTKVKTKIIKKSALVTALKSMGFKSHMIEVSDTNSLQLKGYGGDFRAGKFCSVRIKGSGWGHSSNYVGGASNDLGFEQLSDGSFALHVSDYDKNRYNKQWQGKLLDQYGRAVVHEIVEEQNFFVTSEEEVDGGIRITVESPF